MKLLTALTLLLIAAAPATAPSTTATKPADETQIPLKITGGQDTDPRDHGRPVVLIATALKVPEDVFRETFTHVRPAGPGRNGPTDAEAKANKKALMDGLSPYGVTNDRLNEVSNYYRYASWKHETWRHTDAAGYATVKNGVVTAITLTTQGAGYSSTPKVFIPGFDKTELKVTLSYDTDFSKNGAIKEITIQR